MSLIFCKQSAINVFNCDCVTDTKIPDHSVDLGIFDPPFGLQETGFDKHYKRDGNYVIEGYQEAPEDYELWTREWMTNARRVLKDDGSMYVIIGHTNLRHVLNVAAELKFNLINHIVWKYNFGVNTSKKFVTSHYHVLYLSKSKDPYFNTYCRFGSQEKGSDGGSLLYRDLEDVFIINRDYIPGEKKNQNKLPEELIRKLILYSSKPDDVICDFFMGNFTTAYVALGLGRKVVGYEINKNSYDYHIELISNIGYGESLNGIKKVENIIPINQGKKIDEEERNSIFNDYNEMVLKGLKKKDISCKLQEKYGRGKFSIKNIIDARKNA